MCVKPQCHSQMHMGEIMSQTDLNVDILFLEYESANFFWVHIEDGS